MYAYKCCNIIREYTKRILFSIKMAAPIKQDKKGVLKQDWSQLNYNIQPSICTTLARLKFQTPTPVQVGNVWRISKLKWKYCE